MCRALVLFAAATTSLACGGDGGSSTDSSRGSGGSGGSGGTSSTPATSGAAGSAGAQTAKLGGFSVNVKVDDGVTSVAGAIYDGAVPEKVLWEKRVEAGGCQLLIPKAPFCDPPCGAKTCVEGNLCVSDPNPIAVGDVRVMGVGSAEFTMSPSTTLSYSPPDGVSLPYPPAADGAPIRFTAGGGALGPFTLESEGILPFQITSQVPVSIESGKPLSLTWTRGASSKARINLELNLSHHGGNKGKIACDVEDTGTLALPATLLDQLTGLGVAGFPVIEIGRRATSSARLASGIVELTVMSGTRVDITVPGVVSCYTDAECPTGQTCAMDLRCQ